jgi:hypothetical protein
VIRLIRPRGAAGRRQLPDTRTPKIPKCSHLRAVVDHFVEDVQCQVDRVGFGKRPPRRTQGLVPPALIESRQTLSPSSVVLGEEVVYRSCLGGGNRAPRVSWVARLPTFVTPAVFAVAAVLICQIGTSGASSAAAAAAIAIAALATFTAGIRLAFWKESGWYQRLIGCLLIITAAGVAFSTEQLLGDQKHAVGDGVAAMVVLVVLLLVAVISGSAA